MRIPEILSRSAGIVILVMCVAAEPVAAQGVNMQAVEMIQNMGYRFTEKGLLNSQGQVVDPETFNRQGQASLYQSPAPGTSSAPAGGGSAGAYGNYGNSGNRGNYSNYGGSASSAAGTSEVPILEGGGAGSAALSPDSASRPVIGPSIEMITGGSGTDGAARIGRLPILD